MKKINLFNLILLICLINFSLANDTKKISTTTLNQFNLTDIISDPSGDLYLATEYGGLYRSTDEGENWFLTNTITTKYNISVILYDDFEGLFLGTKDGAFLQSTDKGLSWRIRRGYEYYNGFPPIIHMVQTNKKYKVFVSDDLCYITYDNHNYGISFYAQDDIILPQLNYLFLSNDGIIYTCGQVIMKNNNVEDFFNSKWIDIRYSLKLFSYCLAINKNKRLYIGTEKGIYFLNDNDSTWALLSKDIEKYHISFILIVNNNKMFIGTDSSGMFSSIDTGNTWEKINPPSINSRINKIYEYKNNTLFVLTNMNGMFKSSNNGSNWSSIDTEMNNTIDSLIADGWMPSINYYDQYQNLGQNQYLQFIKNDSAISVKGEQNSISIYNTLSGKFIKSFNYPFNSNYINITGDSIIVSYRRNDSIFVQIYNYYDNNLINTINYTYSYIISKTNYAHLKDAYICFIYIDQINKKLYIKFHTTGTDVYYEKYYYDDILEITDLNSGELLYSTIINKIFTPDMQYYLLPYSLLFTKDSTLVYDIMRLPENSQLISNSNIINACFSPNNKYIILFDSKQNYFFVIDFNNGKILRTIRYTDYYTPAGFGVTYDDNFLVVNSNQGYLRIYNLSNKLDAFDSVIVYPSSLGSPTIPFALAKTKSLISFSGDGGILRLWKPDFSLTSVDEQIDNIKTNNFIFPNPVSDYLSLSDIPDNLSDISIYSVIGNKVLEQKLIDNKIDISTLTPGIYFLKVKDKVYKFVKM